ncbi:hypothetical protein ACTXK7_07380 [Vreelandella alkaliphila]|uniref:hypothetical protein n=1 Tax=Halomonadaceae TaxID=28256 RepID=UPI003CF7692F
MEESAIATPTVIEPSKPKPKKRAQKPASSVDNVAVEMVTTGVIAKKSGMSAGEWIEHSIAKKLVYRKGGGTYLTHHGENAGLKVGKNKHGYYILWPSDFTFTEVA